MVDLTMHFDIENTYNEIEGRFLVFVDKIYFWCIFLVKERSEKLTSSPQVWAPYGLMPRNGQKLNQTKVWGQREWGRCSRNREITSRGKQGNIFEYCSFDPYKQSGYFSKLTWIGHFRINKSVYQHIISFFKGSTRLHLTALI